MHVGDKITVDLGGEWAVVRRGRPSARIRILRRYAIQERAQDRFEREFASMRQGILALIDPDGRIVQFATAPMCRTRW